MPYHASQMYAKNITTFLAHLLKEGKLELDMEDEITSGTLITHGGEVVHPGVRELLGFANAECGDEEKREKRKEKNGD